MPRRVAERARLAALLLGAALPAQAEVLVEAVIAPASARGATPAIAWLCEELLPRHAAWPNGVSPTGALLLRADSEQLQIAASAVAPPDRAIAVGAVHLRGQPAMWFVLDANGVEDWFVSRQLALPSAWRDLLRSLHADALDESHTMSVGVAVAHFAGPLPDDDPRSALLRLGPALCGDATWTTFVTADHLRVRGRSEGGLLLPAALLVLAASAGSAEPDELALRAFAARDADRVEAARQLVRGARGDESATLAALLRGEDDLRLAAIDALVRRGATAELPDIVLAAAPEAPRATLAAGDALRALWRHASPLERQRTRAALQRSNSRDLRAIDVGALTAEARRAPSPRPADDGPDAAFAVRVRTLTMLALLAIGVGGAWALARRRLQANV